MAALAEASPPVREAMGARGQAEVFRRDGQETNLIAFDLRHRGWAGDGELIQTTATWEVLETVGRVDAAVDDEGVAGVEASQRVSDARDKMGGVDAEDLSAGPGGVGHGAEDVEGGADSEGSAERRMRAFMAGWRARGRRRKAKRWMRRASVGLGGGEAPRGCRGLRGRLQSRSGR